METTKPEPKILSASEYARVFELGKDDSTLHTAALEHAKDNRKFEIELYWKRATYFWTLIAAAFAGYFAILAAAKSGDDEKSLLAFTLACIGFVFTYAWFLVNRGSKQWQENWENHVDMLEDGVTGPLYKTVMRRPTDSDEDFAAKHITGPAEVSVSKINQLVNVFTMIIWILLCLHVSNLHPLGSGISVERVVMLVVALAACHVLRKHGRTHVGDHQHVAYIRTTEVLNATSLSAAERKPG